MGSMRLARWLQLLVMTAAGMVVAALSVAGGQVFTGAAIAAGFAALGWWSWPSREGRHVDHARAQADAGDDDVIVYWRPGCHYCARLQLGLRQVRDQVTWVNIWRDDEAAAFVAQHRDGNETVPTVVTGAGELLPATAEAVVARLQLRPGIGGTT